MTKTKDRRAADSAPDTVIAPGNGRALQVRAARFTSEARRVFLDTLAATCNVSAAQRACGMGITACYRLRARDPEFAAAWQQALAIGYDRLEQALLHYSLERVEAAEIDPDAADRAAVEGSVVRALETRTASAEELRFALALLNRHRAAAEQRAPAGRGAPRVSAEETDAALTAKLDRLARQMAGHGKTS
jgi:hypothetical protein